MASVEEKRFRELLAEQRYRRRFLGADSTIAVRWLGAVALLQVVLVRNDWLLLGGTPMFARVVGCRVVVLLLLAATSLALSRTRRAQVFDRLSFAAWFTLVSIGLGLTHARIQTNESVGPSIFMLLALVLVYFGNPAALWAKVLPAALLTAGSLTMLLGPLESHSTAAPSSFLFAFVTINLIGLHASRTADTHRRGLFQKELEERRARRDLSLKVDELAARADDLSDEKERVEALARAKRDFLAAMSHEFRTPMNAVIGLSELLAERNLPLEAAEEATTIRDSAKGLLRMLNDILDYARLDAGKVDIVPIAFDIRALFTSVASMMRPLAHAKGIRLELDVGRELPSWVLADEGRLRQLLVNLTSNAIKFTSVGKVTIRAGSRAHLDGHLLDVSVSDTGIGISTEAVDRIFEPYEQADARTSMQFGGTGLGLPICKKIVEAMRGKIGVTSARGTGSTFSFSIPIGLTRRERPAAEVEVHIPHLRILVVDDNPVNLKVATATLRKLGYEAQTADDGASALLSIMHDRFDLAFVDVQMPGMSGLELAREVRRACPGDQAPRLVAMTANAFDEDRRACFDAGMEDFIAKPIELRASCGVLQRAAVAWSLGAATPEAPARPRHALPVLGSSAFEE